MTLTVIADLVVVVLILVELVFGVIITGRLVRTERAVFAVLRYLTPPPGQPVTPELAGLLQEVRVGAHRG